MSIAKQTLYERSQCSWTLYFIYFNLFNTNINKSAGFLILSADIFPLSSGPSMIPILPSTKNSRLISYQRSSTTKSGITKITSLISNGSTVRRSNRSADVLNATLMTTAHAPAVMLQSLISTRITAQKGSFCAKSAPPLSPRKKTVFQSPTP